MGGAECQKPRENDGGKTMGGKILSGGGGGGLGEGMKKKKGLVRCFYPFLQGRVRGKGEENQRETTEAIHSSLPCLSHTKYLFTG